MIAGGRIRLIMVLCAIIFYYFSRSVLPKEKNKSSKFSLIFITSLIVFFATIVATFRAGETEINKDSLLVGVEKNIKQLVIYNTGPCRAFDYAIEHDFVHQQGGPFLGRATIGGIEEFLNKITRHLVGFEDKHINQKTIYYLQDLIIYVAPDIKFNYAYTNAIYHYFDFGLFGVIIFPFIFGLFTKNVIDKIYYSGSVWLYLMLSFFYAVLMQSTFTLLLVQPFAIPLLVFLYIMHRIKFGRQPLHNTNYQYKLN
jgi:oligosaccharide repeat unit polymerase